MSDSALQTIKDIKRLDDARPGIPGEHWLTLGAGVAVWLLLRRARSPVLRTVGSLAGTALLARAASGRDGLAKALRWLPIGRRFLRG